MATKNFTTDISFNRKSADSLISALTQNQKPKTVPLPTVTKVSDKEAIQKMFGGFNVDSGRKATRSC